MRNAASRPSAATSGSPLFAPASTSFLQNAGSHFSNARAEKRVTVPCDARETYRNHWYSECLLVSPKPRSITATCVSSNCGAWNPLGRKYWGGLGTTSAGHGKSPTAKPVVTTQTRSAPKYSRLQDMSLCRFARSPSVSPARPRKSTGENGSDPNPPGGACGSIERGGRAEIDERDARRGRRQ